MTRSLPTRLTSVNFFRLLILSVCVVALAASLWPNGGKAATPASGKVTTANTSSNPLRYTAGPFNVPNASGFAGALQCNAAMPCDDYALDVDVPDGLLDTHQVRIAMSWPNATADFDYRVYLRNADGTAGAEAISIGSSADPEVGVLPASKRSYIVRVIPFAPLGQSIAMAISVESKAGRFNAATGTAPRYANYQPSGGLGADAAEPTLGVNWRTGRVMFISSLETLRVTFNDSVSPATATWEDKSFLLTSLTTLDPILYTDRDTGRTIVSQLAGTNSLSALTDDDGETWIPNEGGPLTSGVDHQTIGGGPYHAPLNGGTAAYPNAVYYCSQDLVTAFCARSDDGGLTYGPTVPMQILTCGAIHGHVQVAPDGTVYVPHRQCNSNQAVVVSEDNGITWAIRTVADTDQTSSTYDSIPGDWDPGVGVGGGGTVYFGYENGDGTPHVAVSYDRGQTWVDDQNVGIPYGIRNTAFPTVIAGDDDRAAFAFHGSTDANNTDAGVWHLYVATTYDRGKTWSVVNATPNDPVQRGSICTEGFGVDACAKGDRNLLDFMDIQVDKQGRVLVGYADGCVGCSSPSGSRSKLATIARQTCGPRLFKQYDPLADDCGGTPTPTPTATPTPTPTATPTPTTTPTPSNDVRCTVPGLSVITDAAGDQTGAPNANASQDIRSVSIAEKYPAGASGQLVFTMKVGDLTSTVTPNASWRVAFNATHADNSFTTYFVTVANNSNSNPAGVSYNYGFVDTSRNNLNSTVGTADGGSMDATNDTLTVVLNLNKLRKPIAAATGQTLTGAQVDLSAGKTLGTVNAATSLLVGALGTGLNVNVDSTGNGNYTMAGAATCPPAVTATPTPTPTSTPTGGADPATAARFHNFAAPAGVAEAAGEPSIGVNWKTERTFGNSSGLIPNGGTVNYYGGFLPYMLRVTFDDSVSPAAAKWDQANLVVANAPRVFGDPILFTDSKTGRTFVSQELGLTPLGSTMEFTDDDGRSFTPSTGSGAPSGIDHQTVGGGPFAQPIPSGVSPIYPHGVWYCSQSIADAVCAISLDGGITFGPSVPMYTIADCAGLHGHIKIGPDGTAYIPNKACGGSLPFHDTGGKQSLIVSEDNGVTWKIRPIPQSTTSADRDPSVGIAADNTVYFAYQAADGRSRVAVSRNKGVTWTDDTDIGAPLNVKNSLFHAAVAGDANRAAVAFYGTETGGPDFDTPGFAGVWYLYVSTTYDGGKTWTTVNATPNDPVQRGGICGDGECRNLLDFFDATIDKRGRVLVGYDDGCIGACVQGGANSFTAKAVIARQSGGKRMFAAYDPPATSLASAPAVSASRNGSTVNLSWTSPDNGGSAITNYKIYRRDANGVTLLGTANGTTFTDTAYTTGQVYRVVAVNNTGEGAYKEFNPSGITSESACDGAGVLVVNDLNNEGGDLDTQQNTPPDARVNVKSLHVAEPFLGAGQNKLVFTLKVGNSTAGNTAPPSSQWFIIWNSRAPNVDFDRRYVAMLSDAQGNVRFEYGKFGSATPLDGSTVPSPNTNQPVKLGDASGSYNPANGTITITLPTSNAENIGAGQSISGINVRTFFARPEAGIRNAATASDITGDGSYTLAGNASCSGGASSASMTPNQQFDSVAWQIAAQVLNFTL